MRPSQRSHERTSSDLALELLRKLPWPGRDQKPCIRMDRSSGFRRENERPADHNPSAIIRLKNGNKVLRRTPLSTRSAWAERKPSSSGSLVGRATMSFSSTVWTEPLPPQQGHRPAGCDRDRLAEPGQIGATAGIVDSRSR